MVCVCTGQRTLPPSEIYSTLGSCLAFEQRSRRLSAAHTLGAMTIGNCIELCRPSRSFTKSILAAVTTHWGSLASIQFHLRLLQRVVSDNIWMTSER